MDGKLPLIDATGLSPAQRHGAACVSCSKAWPRPEVACGRTGAGEILYRCGECELVIEAEEA